MFYACAKLCLFAFPGVVRRFDLCCFPLGAENGLPNFLRRPRTLPKFIPELKASEHEDEQEESHFRFVRQKQRKGEAENEEDFTRL